MNKSRENSMPHEMKSPAERQVPLHNSKDLAPRPVLSKPIRRSAWQDVKVDRTALLNPKKSRPRSASAHAALKFVNALASMDDFADVSDMAQSAGIDQKEFLLAVMSSLDLTRQGLSRRLSTSVMSINKWMDSPGGANRRQLPPTVWKHLGDVMRQHLSKKNPK